MPGTGLADFFNPLRLYGEAGLRAVDIFFDVILPELASSLDEPNALVSREQMDAVRQRGDRFFTDPEAFFIRPAVGRREQPTHPFPGGGSLPDITWAFNQATGARPLDDSAVLPGRNRTRLSWLNEGDVLSLHAVGNALSVVLTRRCRRI